MNVEDLTEQFTESVRAEVEREIARAKKVVAALNADKAKAQTALSELQAQYKLAQDQLAAVTADLHRASGLVGLDSEIAGARKTLEALKGETAETTTALELLAKQRKEREAQVIALGNEAQRLIAVRTEGEAVMANIKRQLRSVQIGDQR